MPKDISQFVNAPIPGQSLTQSPDARQPWETPPEITDLKEARELLFKQFIDPNRLPHLLTLVESGMPVTKIAIEAAKQGFKNGLWTPDLVLSLIEPTSIMIIAIARKFNYEPVLADEDVSASAEDNLNMMRQLQTKRQPTAAPTQTMPIEESTSEVPSLLGGNR